jgi:hypothetical protein
MKHHDVKVNRGSVRLHAVDRWDRLGIWMTIVKCRVLRVTPRAVTRDAAVHSAEAGCAGPEDPEQVFEVSYLAMPFASSGIRVARLRARTIASPTCTDAGCCRNSSQHRGR